MSPNAAHVARNIAIGILLASCASGATYAQQTAKKAYVFRGKVEKVDVQTNQLSVANENIPGWMGPMVMGYRVENREILKELKPGDTITATVYEGDFSTLYAVKVERPGAAAGTGAAGGAAGLPPIVYACPTPGHELDVADAPGKCAKSEAQLVPIRIVQAWSCLKNNAIIREAPGVCPTDRTPLVPIIASLYFTCRGDVRTRYLDPGTCADGSARLRQYERRPHGDHNARHGGDFIRMASDNLHHVEGTFVAPNLFRVYFYNEQNEPLTPDAFVAQVAVTDKNAQETGPRIALRHAPGSPVNTLEAAIPGAKFRIDLKLRVQFKPGDKEHAFDFTFNDFSKEP